jgi:hypothetical protein
MGGETLRCGTHLERLAVGMCNDCGRSFCGACLHIYSLETRDTTTMLFLDATCLRKRRAERANKALLGGILVLFYGILSSVVSLMLGIVFVIFGGALVGYGILRRKETPTESTVEEAMAERRRIEADSKLKGAADAEKLYNELLEHYVLHWGAATGTELLKTEINACMRQGASFSEAVKRVYARPRRP